MTKEELVRKILAADFSVLSEEKLAEIFWLINQVEEPKEACPSCGYTRLAPFRDKSYKLCTKCYTEIPWLLKDKQKPLIQHQR
jgi:protein-arginine kinase activator protein McsA